MVLLPFSFLNRSKFSRFSYPDGFDASVVENFEFDMCIIASGKRVPIDGFNRRSLDAKLAIAVTANFVNTASKEEVLVNQISGISKQYHQVILGLFGKNEA